MRISRYAYLSGTKHFFERMEERVKYFENRKEALDFSMKALAGRETSYTFHEGTDKSKIVSDDLVFILDTTDSWNITIITVYTYSEYLTAS